MQQVRVHRAHRRFTASEIAILRAYKYIESNIYISARNTPRGKIVKYHWSVYNKAADICVRVRVHICVKQQFNYPIGIM